MTAVRHALRLLVVALARLNSGKHDTSRNPDLHTKLRKPCREEWEEVLDWRYSVANYAPDYMREFPVCQVEFQVGRCQRHPKQALLRLDNAQKTFIIARSPGREDSEESIYGG